MTNFQFYLNSPLRGQFVLCPADRVFLKPFSAFWCLLGCGSGRFGFPGGCGLRCCPVHPGSGGFAISPGLIFPVLTKAEGWNNNLHHPKQPGVTQGWSDARARRRGERAPKRPNKVGRGHQPCRGVPSAAGLGAAGPPWDTAAPEPFGVPEPSAPLASARAPLLFLGSPCGAAALLGRSLRRICREHML